MHWTFVDTILRIYIYIYISWEGMQRITKHKKSMTKRLSIKMEPLIRTIDKTITTTFAHLLAYTVSSFRHFLSVNYLLEHVAELTLPLSPHL